MQASAHNTGELEEKVKQLLSFVSQTQGVDEHFVATRHKPILATNYYA